jgi:localization factor PodJL
MKPGIPWSVKGIEGKAREVAKDAARAQGMTLGEWLNHKILEGASEEADLKSRATRKKATSSVSSSRSRTRQSSSSTNSKASSSKDDEVVRKLDMLVDRLSNLHVPDIQPLPATAQHALSAHTVAEDEHSSAMAMQRLLERIEQGEQRNHESVTVLSDKVERIGSRVEEIAEQPLELKAREVPGFSALEGAVRNIVDHIEKSEKQSRDVMTQLQGRIAELDGKIDLPSANDGKPEIVADLEERMQELAARVEQASSGKNDKELKSMFESRIRELAERIDTVRHSAEAIGQKAEATASKAAAQQASAIEERLASLIEQAEQKLQESDPDDSGLRALQTEISALHNRFEDIHKQTASEQEVQALRSALEKLSSKVEENPGLEPIAQIEQRIADLTAQLQQVSQPADYQPQLGALEERVHALDTQFAAAAAKVPQAPELGSQMNVLEQRLAATEQQLGSLATIENSIQQLFASLEESRAEARALAEKSATNISTTDAEQGEPSAELKALQEGLAAVQENADAADQRTQETLEAVHETLAQIISKLSDLDADKPAAQSAMHDFADQPAGDAVAVNAAAAAAAMANADEATALQPPSDAQQQPASPQDFDPFNSPGTDAVANPAAPDLVVGASETQSSQDQDWLTTVRSHLQQNHGMDPGQSASVAPETMNTAQDSNLGDSHVDFIAAARRAASSAAPQGPAGGALGNAANGFGDFNPHEVGEGTPQSKISSLLSRGASRQSAADNKPEGENGGSRKRLLLAAAVLLAAVSAYAMNSGMLSPATTKQSSLEAPTASAVVQSAGAETEAGSSTAVLELPASGPAVEVPQADNRADRASADPITTASVTPTEGSDPLLSQTPSALGNSLASAQAPISDVEVLPDGIGPEPLRQAALSGDASAQFIVASRYLEGRTVGRDHEKAARWYTRAANGGLAAAQYRIGTLHERGSGVKQDRFQAMSWYAKAAAQGNVKSMHNLAVMSADTTQGKPDMARAAKWFAAAAAHGLPDSQYNLAVLYERGLGLQKNTNEAFKWYSLAAKRGDRDAIKKAEALKAAVDKTTLAQIEQAVSGWKPQAPQRDANMVSITDPSWGVGNANQQASAQQAVPQQPATRAPVTTLTEKDQVKLTQQLLAQKGFDPGSADGKMGSRTANAIRLYQLRNGLPVNGSVSKQLLQHLQQGTI